MGDVVTSRPSEELAREKSAVVENPGTNFTKLDMNANRDRVFRVEVHESSNEIADDRTMLTFMPAPADLVEAEVPLGPRCQTRVSI